MADMNMLYTALLNADKAGDNESAATLATYIKSLQSGTPAAATPPVQTGPRILPETDTSSDFFRGLGNYPGQTESLLGSVQTVGGLAAQKMGFEDTGKSWIKSGLGKIAEGERKTTSRASDEFTEAWEKGIGTVLTDWLPYQVGAGAANIMESLAFSALGAGVGALTGAGAGAVPGAAAGLVSKTLVKRGIKEAAEEVLRKETAKAIAEGATKEAAKDAGKVAAKAFVESEAKRVIPELVGKETFAAGAQEYGKAGAKKLGSYAGTGAQAITHGVGEVGQQAIKAAEERGEGIEDVDLGRVLPAAAVHAVADFVNNRIGLGALKIGDAASKRLVTEIAKRIAVTGLKETGGEEIQSIAERYGAKLSLTDADALKDYINTAAASFGMAVAPGAIGGFRTHLNQQLQNRPTLPGEPEIETEEQKEAKVGKTVLTQQELDDLMSGKAVIPITTGKPKSASKLTAEEILDQYPVGEEQEFPKSGIANLKKILASLGIEEPVVNKGAGEHIRTLLIQALRDHYTKKYAARTATATGVTEEELETYLNSIPDEQEGTTTKPPVDETKPPVEEVKPPVNETKPPVEEVKPPVDETKPPVEEVKPPTAAPVKITPAQQTAIDAMQREINDLVASNTSATEVQGYVDDLNAYKTSLGIPTTTLSAKAKTIYAYRNPARIDELQVQLDQARSTGESQRQINKLKDALEEERAKPRRVTIADQQEEEAIDPLDVEAVRAKLARDKAQQEQDEAEAREKGELKYYPQNLPENTQALYTANRTDANALVQQENEQLKSLIAQRTALSIQLSKLRNILIGLDKKYDDSSLNENDKVAAEIKTAEAQLKSIDAAIEENGPEQTLVPEWGQLTFAEKNHYFSFIKRNTRYEHANAADALREFRKQLNKRNEGYGKKETKQKLTTEDKNQQEKIHRAALAYDENREGYSSDFAFSFPRWADLSKAAKKAFLDKVISVITDPVTGKRTFEHNGTGVLEIAGFVAAGRQIITEANDLNTAQKQQARDNFKRRQEDIAEQTETNKQNRAESDEYYRRINETTKTKPLVKTKDFVPDHVVKMVKAGDLRGVLQYLRTLGKDQEQERSTFGVKILRQMAQALYDMEVNANLDPKLRTKIRLVDKLPDNDLAIYNPENNTIYVTAEGLTSSTLLHEIIHAATVKVLNLYSTNEGKQRHLLTEGQKRAAQHLFDMMNATKNLVIAENSKGDPMTMKMVHPEAYSNIFEFVAYALSDEVMQEDLASVEIEIDSTILELPKATIDSIMPERSAWTNFKIAMVELLGLEKLFAKGGKFTLTAKKNFLMEISAAFEDILSVPTEPIYLDANLPTKGKQNKPPLKAAEPRTEEAHKIPEKVAPKSFTKWLGEKLFTPQGHLFLELRFQNKRAVLRKLYEQLAKSRLVIYTGEKINDIYGQITTSVADAKNYFNRYIDQDLTDLNSSIGRFARAANLSTKKALEVLHPYLEALHEPERRLVKYLLTVPLNKMAATERELIIRILDTQALDKAGVQRLRDKLDSLVFAKDAQGNFITHPTTGKRTLTNNVEIKKGKQFHDIDNANYNATGLTTEESTKFRNDPLIKEHQAEVDKIIAAMQKLAKSTAELNKIGHFWSHLVDNRVNFYGWEHYIPLKGYVKQSEVDEMLDFDGKKMGADLQEKVAPFGGRKSVANNPILQMAADATRSAIRAGQRNLTLSIKNSILQGLFPGKILGTISFEDRANKDIVKQYEGENNIFHYNDDGTIDILYVENKDLRNSIRQTFQASSPLIEKANLITGLIAQGHTRYNYNFGPMNFVRDALTNAFVIGAEMGPAKAAEFIKAMTAVVVNGGMYKAMQVAMLYKNGHDADIKRLEQMAKTDTFVAHMYELIKQGGMVTHLSGLSLKSQLEDLQKEIGQSGVMQKKEQFDKFVDTWTNMFEIASRTSAYMVAKQNYKTENMARGMDEKQAEAEASARAVSFSKNLANFEQVGEWGKAMGALYMFFRPSATGAARSLQAVAPAFTSLASAVEALPDAVKNNPAALETFKKNYSLQKRNAQIMVSSLIALGFFAHTMSKMMAPDDDLGRNAVDADDMDRWVRYARFHIPNGISTSMGLGKDVVFQMPWGMGLGAFAAAGAQLSAIYDGKTPLVKGLANIFGSVALDSFVPIPISKMPITDSPISFLLDSIAPSMARPALEFALNKNGLGQAIHNDQSRRMGDAYTGGDNIPQIYKDASRGIANATVGDFDWNPNTLYFLTNTYMDGPGRVIETLYGINDLAQRRKDFSPKTDIPLMGSFFGTKVNIDAQQFTNIENKIKRIEGVMKEFATDPEMEAKYAEKHPLHASVVEYYNKELAPLNELRKEANEYRLNQYLTPKERSELLKLNTMQANVMKNQMIEVFKAYDIKP